MNTNYIVGPFASAAISVLSCTIIRYGIRDNIYETERYRGEFQVLRDKYEKLSSTRKVINGLAQICLAAFTSALLHAAIGHLFFIRTNISNSVKKFTIIGAVIGAILGAMYEPKLGDFFYYNVFKHEYCKYSDAGKKYM